MLRLVKYLPTKHVSNEFRRTFTPTLVRTLNFSTNVDPLKDVVSSKEDNTFKYDDYVKNNVPMNETKNIKKQKINKKKSQSETLQNPINKDVNWKTFPAGSHNFITIGEMGCGKSTLLNTLTSYLHDCPLDNPRLCIPTAFRDATEKFKHTEKNVSDRSVSQTSDVSDYTFSVNDAEIVFTDTPGLNDQRGYDKDNETLDKIIDSIINAKNISGIIFAINGTNARLTTNAKLLLNRMNSFIPDNVMKNMIVVFTMCRQDTCNFDIKQLENYGINPAKIIYINNTAFSSDHNTWTDIEILNYEWNESFKSCNELMMFGTNLSKASSFEFEQMKKIRNNIKSNLHNIKLKINNFIKLQDEYLNNKELFDKLSIEKELNKNYTTTKTLTQKVFVPHTHHSTVCQNCNTICHFECGLDEISQNSEYRLRNLVNCLCFDGSQNGVCRNCKCTVHSHYHARIKEETRTVNVAEEIKELKQKYLDSIKKLENVSSELSEYDIVKQSIVN